MKVIQNTATVTMECEYEITPLNFFPKF